jgi:hypothetical protein
MGDMTDDPARRSSLYAVATRVKYVCGSFALIRGAVVSFVDAHPDWLSDRVGNKQNAINSLVKRIRGQIEGLDVQLIVEEVKRESTT